MANEKILFVDDEDSILTVFGEYFQEKGYQVFTARNGIEAVKILEKEIIDCCFTDINMPEMDGIELAEYIWKSDNTIPVVIMTGYPSLENTISTIKNGVVDFLIKPVNLSQMELCIKRVFRERRLFVDNIFLHKEAEKKAQLEKINEELLDKVEELHIFNKIMSDFASVSTSHGVFKQVVDMTIGIVHAEESKFYVINKEEQSPVEVVAAFESTASGVETKANSHAAFQKLIMRIVSDKLPLLVPENKGAYALPVEVRSFIGVPLTIRGKVFGVLTASIKNSDIRFTGKDLYYLSFMTHNAAYAIENLALYENIYANLFSTLYAFVKAVEAKDPYTQQHSNRVTVIAIALAKEMGCTAEELEILNFAGRLHDIGKLGISDAILLKQGKLTDEEFMIIKEHPVVGSDIVGQLGLWEREQQIIKCHHERFDGKGYPDGLTGDEIPLLARILFVADAFDAMDSDRAYRKRMERDMILKIIKDEAGAQFDPDVVSAFQKIYKEGKI